MKLRNSKLYWQINEQIRAPKVRVIGADGKQLGIMAIGKALETAKKENLTLVEIAPNAKPPVVKIVEFGKFRYQEEKKLRAQAKKTKVSELKEIRFSPFIAENDFKVRLVKIKEFLEDKNKVKLVVVFKRRQLGSKQFGYNVLIRVVSELGDTISTDMEPKFLGRNLIMIISPLGKGKKVKEAKDA